MSTNTTLTVENFKVAVWEVDSFLPPSTVFTVAESVAAPSPPSNPVFTVAQWEADSSLPSSYSIADNAADLSAAGVLNALEADAAHITSIVVSKNKPLTANVAQITSDANVLGLLHDANGNPYTLIVSDTGVDISTDLNALNADTHVSGIEATGAVTVDAAQLTSDAIALNILSATGGVTVIDTQANIQAAYDLIGDDSAVTAIGQENPDNGSHPLTLTAAQAANVTEFEEIYDIVPSNFTAQKTAVATVVDTAAHITANIAALTTEGALYQIIIPADPNAAAYSPTDYLATITVSDNAAVKLTAIECINLCISGTNGYYLPNGNHVIPIGADLVNANGSEVTININDTGADIIGNLTALQKIISVYNYFFSFTVNDGNPVPITVSLLQNDLPFLSSITTSGGQPPTFTLTDTAANISTVLASLEIDIAHHGLDITSIVVSDGGAITASIHALTADAAVFACITGSYSLSIVDTSVHVSTALATLETYAAAGALSAVTLTDNGALSFTVAQLATYANIVAVLSDRDGATDTVAIVDSAQNVVAGLANLSGPSIASITLTDTTPVLNLTEAQFTANQTALGNITNSAFAITVTGVTVAQLATVETDFTTLNGANGVASAATLAVQISDTGGDITDAYLQSLGGDSKVTSIVVTSGAIALTEAQFTGSAEHAGLVKLAGSYTVDVTGVTVAQVAAVEAVTGLGGTPTVLLAVADTGAHLTDTALQSLGSDSKVTSIAVSSGVLTLTGAQITGTAELEGLAKFIGSYTVDVTGVSAANVSTVETVTGLGGTPTLSIAVSDTGSDFTDAALQSLGSDGHVTSISVAGGAISLTESQFTGSPELAGLAKMIGSYTVDVTGVSVANVAAVEAVTGLGGTPTLAIAVSDTAGDVTDAALQSLGSDSKVTSIAVTSGTISLSEGQFTGSAELAGLTKLVGSYTVDVSGVTYAEVSAVEAVSLGGSPALSIAVSDTGGNFTDAALQSLGSDSKVTSIAVTSGAISLSEGQFTGAAELAGLAKITNGYTVDVSAVSVANVVAVEAVTGLGGAPTLAIAVSDTGSDVTDAALQSLGSDSKVTSIAVTSGAISLTESQFTGSPELAGLAKLTGSYTVDVMGVSVANVAAVEAVTGLGGTPTLAIAVSDTAGDITDAALQSLGSDSKVTSIAVTSGTISLSEGQFTGSAELAGLIKLVGSYTVDVSGVSYSEVSAVEAVSLGGSPSLSVAVSDTGGDFTDAALQSLGGDSHVASIAVSGGAINLTGAQFAGSAESLAFAKFTGAYTVDVTGVAVSQLSAVEGVVLEGAPNLSIAVVDTASGVQGGLATLESDVANISSIALSSGTSINLTESQLNADVSALGKIVTNFALNVTNAHAADVAAITSTVGGISGATALTVVVNDTAADIGTGYVLETLNVSTVTSIVISDNATVVMNAPNAVSSTVAIEKMSNALGGTVMLEVSDKAVNIDALVNRLQTLYTSLNPANWDLGSIVVSDNAALNLSGVEVRNDAAVIARMMNANSQPIVINVTDTAADLSSASVISALKANNYVDSITDSSNTAVTVTAAEIAADPSVLAEIVYASGGTAALVVSDTGANIQTNIATLNADTQITAIDVSNHAQLVLTMAQVLSNAHALGILVDSAGVEVADTAANLQGHLDALQIQVTAHVVNQIVDSNNAAMTISEEEANNDLGAIADVAYKSGGVVTLNVTGNAGGATLYSETWTSGAITSTTADANSLTFTPIASTAGASQSFTVTGHTAETFDFTGSFGAVKVTGFNVTSDLIAFSHLDFANIAAVEAAETQVSGNTVITLDAHDAITFVGITNATFNAHTADWSFI